MADIEDTKNKHRRVMRLVEDSLALEAESA